MCGVSFLFRVCACVSVAGHFWEQERDKDKLERDQEWMPENVLGKNAGESFRPKHLVRDTKQG